MSPQRARERAISPATGVFLMIAVTMVLAALVLLMMVQLPSFYTPAEVPGVFKIINIQHEPKWDSYMVVMNTGTTGYLNSNLYGMTYRNGELLPASLSTMNGYAFVPTHHYGIQTFGGPGSKGRMWDPNEMVAIDFKDRTFHPGDVVTFEVYDGMTQQILSRHTYTA